MVGSIIHGRPLSRTYRWPRCVIQFLGCWLFGRRLRMLLDSLALLWASSEQSPTSLQYHGVLVRPGTGVSRFCGDHGCRCVCLCGFLPASYGALTQINHFLVFRAKVGRIGRTVFLIPSHMWSFHCFCVSGCRRGEWRLAISTVLRTVRPVRLTSCSYK